jgi:3-oxoacyl-[acyl-carrier protein] reductase
MKKAIITGASSGLGFETGKLLKEKGVQVINVSRKESEFENIKADLSKNQEIEQLVKQIKEKHSDFDTLILNAGIMSLADTGEIDFDIDELFKININSTIKIVNDLFELIKKNNADLVIVGSTAGLNGYKKHSAYCATKHATIGFIKSLQEELKSENVRVIGFHPGGFNSNLRGGIMKEGYMKPEDLAKLMVQLLELPRSMEVSEVVIKRKAF